MFDLIVRQGIVDGRAVDIGVTDGMIEAVASELSGARHELYAGGHWVLPGGLDPHVHFNEPGRTHWEGFATGSAALAAGGYTAFFDMPLNSSPPVVDGAAFDAKLEAARASSCVDFGLWGGLVPGRLDRLEELAARGVIGLKAFMSNSGIEEFERVDDVTLYEGMAIAARLGLIVAVHAENDALTARSFGPGARDWFASRPVVAELEAISRALLFASETGCALHVVHVSSGRGAALIAAAREAGVDVTCETCPHYLFLTPEDVEALGAVAKCAPPVRDATEQIELWRRLRAGEVEMVVSDHSPSEPALKEGAFGDAWGGIASCQSTRELLLLGELDPDFVGVLTATAPAERFGIPRKGRIAPGYDADLALIDPHAPHTLRAEDLRYRHQVSPYVGRTFRARVTHTLLRGAIPAAGAGRLLRPTMP
ncbi:allantoinase AllB [Solirubrobacter soli]|uniref:allantoinase AllB n=1 Tax=Solirubrobacter soli TaxID=363832 RepID=UPI000423BDE4|nr:allantoinase AllB [Solirubrobacter soli]